MSRPSEIHRQIVLSPLFSLAAISLTFCLAAVPLFDFGRRDMIGPPAPVIPSHENFSAVPEPTVDESPGSG
jgi:hypothetical protein